MSHRTPYHHQIESILDQMGCSHRYDPRHIEAFMRLEYGTLDRLSPSKFRSEVRFGMACIDEAGSVASEELAQSYGL